MKRSRSLPLPLLRQHRLDLPPPSVDAPFVVTRSNAAAVAAIDAYPAWPNGALALVGPEASGKSRLARDWAERADGVWLAPATAVGFDSLGRRPAVLDDAQATSDETLFHLINRAASGAGDLLLTGRTPPVRWPVTLPDLRSRLNAIAVAELEEPDDAALEALLSALLAGAGIRPGPDLLPYLLARIERSAANARTLVCKLDAYALEEGRDIDRRLAKRILDADDEPDLFG